MLATNGINTGVLYNGDGFQICNHFDERLSFSDILERGKHEEIILATQLIAKTMVKYHTILVRNQISYPIAKMIQDAMDGITQRKFSEGNYPRELDDLFATCQKILAVLSRSPTAHQFSQNDLFTNSIFVDLENQKVTIVDWEYSASAYWSNDLAKLCFPLPTAISTLLSNYYYCEMSRTSNVSMPESMRQEVQLNSFLHKFLKVAWSIKPSNVVDFEKVISSMMIEKTAFSGELDRLYQALSSNPVRQAPSNSVRSFIRQHPYWASAGLFAGTAVGTALYARYSETPGKALNSIKRMVFSQSES